VPIVFDRLFATFAAEQARDPCRYGLVHQVRRSNPPRMAFLGWIGSILRHLRAARGWRERPDFTFGPAAWSAAGSRLTAVRLTVLVQTLAPAERACGVI